MSSFRPYTGLPSLQSRRAWAEIDTEALKDNYRTLCDLTPGTRHISVVKADAYGHTVKICVEALLEVGCDFFAVSCIEEAIEVKEICNFSNRHADVLILGYTAPEETPLLIRHDIIQTAVDESHAISLAEKAALNSKKLRVHIALDTGMNRIGLCARSGDEATAAADTVKRLCSLPSLSVEGLFTHFAKADEDELSVTSEGSHTRNQFSRFLAVKNILDSEGIRLFSHVCNSAAAVRFPEFALDGVRLGILLYGATPSGHFSPLTRPVMKLKTVISHVHSLNSGESVGYGGRFSAKEDREIATLPIGYADGLLRAFGGFCVTVHTKGGNKKAPVVGSICMDQCMIDVTALGADAGDEVTVFGEDSRELSLLASLADTIEYEVLCLVSGRIPRFKK